MADEETTRARIIKSAKVQFGERGISPLKLFSEENSALIDKVPSNICLEPNIIDVLTIPFCSDLMTLTTKADERVASFLLLLFMLGEEVGALCSRDHSTEFFEVEISDDKQLDHAKRLQQRVGEMNGKGIQIKSIEIKHLGNDKEKGKGIFMTVQFQRRNIWLKNVNMIYLMSDLCINNLLVRRMLSDEIMTLKFRGREHFAINAVLMIDHLINLVMMSTGVISNPNRLNDIWEQNKPMKITPDRPYIERLYWSFAKSVKIFIKSEIGVMLKALEQNLDYSYMVSKGVFFCCNWAKNDLMVNWVTPTAAEFTKRILKRHSSVMIRPDFDKAKAKAIAFDIPVVVKDTDAQLQEEVKKFVNSNNYGIPDEWSRFWDEMEKPNNKKTSKSLYGLYLCKN